MKIKFNELSKSSKIQARYEINYLLGMKSMASIDAFCCLFKMEYPEEVSIDKEDHKNSYVKFGGFCLAHYPGDMKYARLWNYLNKRFIEKINLNCDLTGHYMDAVLMAPVVNFMAHPYDISFKELLQLCADDFIAACEKPFNDDCYDDKDDKEIIQICEKNKLYFYEDGRRTWDED